MIIGIDPGKAGCCAALSRDGSIDLLPMPLVGDKFNPKVFMQWIRGDSIALIVLECNKPWKGGLARWSQGHMIGSIESMLMVLELPYRLVRAQTWKPEILRDYNWRQNKQAAVEYVAARYPTVNLLRTERSKKRWVDAADAICIAEYGERYLAKGE